MSPKVGVRMDVILSLFSPKKPCIFELTKTNKMISQSIYNNAGDIEHLQVGKDSIIETVNADIVLGMPKKGCQYHGICKIDPFEAIEDSNRKLPVNTVHATICKTDKDDLVIQFAKFRMQQVTYDKHFAKSEFTVLQSIEVPDFINKKLKGNFYIKAGNYPIQRRQAYYQVTFQQVD